MLSLPQLRFHPGVRVNFDVPSYVRQLVLVEALDVAKGRACLWSRRSERWMPAGEFFPVTLGRGGTIASAQKKEGDGKTPEGLFPLRRLFVREDARADLRLGRLRIATVPVVPEDKWIDDPDHRDYNRRVRGITTAKSFEPLWRSSGVYDLVLEIGYNDSPVEPGRGSAIFLHGWASPDESTAGCVAAALADLKVLVTKLDSSMAPSILIRPIL